MRIFIFFDLPTDTPEDRKNYSIFRKKLMKLGYSMIQFSVYSKLINVQTNSFSHLHVDKNYIDAHRLIEQINLIFSLLGMSRRGLGGKEKKLLIFSLSIILYSRFYLDLFSLLLFGCRQFSFFIYCVN